MKIILHTDRSGINLLKKMPNFTKLPLLFNGMLGFETFCEHTSVMYFGAVNTRAAGKITVRTLVATSCMSYPKANASMLSSVRTWNSLVLFLTRIFGKSS